MTYHLGQLRIAWYLDRYDGIKISSTGVREVLLRHGLNRLPKNAKTRTVQTTRYESNSILRRDATLRHLFVR